MHKAKELEGRDQGHMMTTDIHCMFGREPRGDCGRNMGPRLLWGGIVTSPKPLCPMLGKAKTQNVKAPIENMGVLMVPQIKRRGNRRGKRWLIITKVWAPAGVRGRPWNLFIPHPLIPADLSPVLKLLKIFDKQLLFLYIFPHLLRRGTFWQGAVFINLRLEAELH